MAAERCRDRDLAVRIQRHAEELLLEQELYGGSYRFSDLHRFGRARLPRQVLKGLGPGTSVAASTGSATEQRIVFLSTQSRRASGRVRHSVRPVPQ